MLASQSHCPPWTLRAWPPVLWQLGTQTPLHLKHISTQITDPGSGLVRTYGQTVWACRSDMGEAGLAWDWIELGQGVVAMADPLAVVTNLVLLHEEGGELTRLEAARHINVILHSLPWQDAVNQALDDMAQDQPGSTRRMGAWQHTTH